MSHEILSAKEVADLIFLATMDLSLLKHTGNIQREVETAFTRLKRSHDLLEEKYRRTLWLQHGCPIAQSVDDKTMRCGGRQEFPDDARSKPHGWLDFQTDTILDLETELAKMKLVESGVRIPNLNDDPWRWNFPSPPPTSPDTNVKV